MGHARNRAGSGKEVSWCTYCMPGPKPGAGEQDYVFQSLGVARVTEEGVNREGTRGETAKY